MKMKNYIPGGDQVLPKDQSQDTISADRTEADVQDANILPEDRPPVASPEQPPPPVASPEQILGAMGIDPLFPVDQAEDSVSSNVGLPGASDTDSELQSLGASAGASAGHSASMASGSSTFPRVSPLIVEDNFTYLTDLDSRLNTLMRDLTRDEKLEAYSHVKGMDVPTVLYNIHHNR